MAAGLLQVVGTSVLAHGVLGGLLGLGGKVGRDGPPGERGRPGTRIHLVQGHPSETDDLDGVELLPGDIIIDTENGGAVYQYEGDGSKQRGARGGRGRRQLPGPTGRRRHGRRTGGAWVSKGNLSEHAASHRDVTPGDPLDFNDTTGNPLLRVSVEEGVRVRGDLLITSTDPAAPGGTVLRQTAGGGLGFFEQGATAEAAALASIHPENGLSVGHLSAGVSFSAPGIRASGESVVVDRPIQLTAGANLQVRNADGEVGLSLSQEGLHSGGGQVQLDAATGSLVLAEEITVGAGADAPGSVSLSAQGLEVRSGADVRAHLDATTGDLSLAGSLAVAGDLEVTGSAVLHNTLIQEVNNVSLVLTPESPADATTALLMRRTEKPLVSGSTRLLRVQVAPAAESEARLIVPDSVFLPAGTTVVVLPAVGAPFPPARLLSTSYVPQRTILLDAVWTSEQRDRLSGGDNDTTIATYTRTGDVPAVGPLPVTLEKTQPRLFVPEWALPPGKTHSDLVGLAVCLVVGANVQTGSTITPSGRHWNRISGIDADDGTRLLLSRPWGFPDDPQAGWLEFHAGTHVALAWRDRDPASQDDEQQEGAFELMYTHGTSVDEPSRRFAPLQTGSLEVLRAHGGVPVFETDTTQRRIWVNGTLDVDADSNGVRLRVDEAGTRVEGRFRAVGDLLDVDPAADTVRVASKLAVANSSLASATAFEAITSENGSVTVRGMFKVYPPKAAREDEEPELELEPLLTTVVGPNNSDPHLRVTNLKVQHLRRDAEVDGTLLRAGASATAALKAEEYVIGEGDRAGQTATRAVLEVDGQPRLVADAQEVRVRAGRVTVQAGDTALLSADAAAGVTLRRPGGEVAVEVAADRTALYGSVDLPHVSLRPTDDPNAVGPIVVHEPAAFHKGMVVSAAGAAPEATEKLEVSAAKGVTAQSRTAEGEWVQLALQNGALTTNAPTTFTGGVRVEDTLTVQGDLVASAVEVLLAEEESQQTATNVMRYRTASVLTKDGTATRRTLTFDCSLWIVDRDGQRRILEVSVSPVHGQLGAKHVRLLRRSLETDPHLTLSLHKTGDRLELEAHGAAVGHTSGPNTLSIHLRAGQGAGWASWASFAATVGWTAFRGTVSCVLPILTDEEEESLTSHGPHYYIPGWMPAVPLLTTDRIRVPLWDTDSGALLTAAEKSELLDRCRAGNITLWGPGLTEVVLSGANSVIASGAAIYGVSGAEVLEVPFPTVQPAWWEAYNTFLGVGVVASNWIRVTLPSTPRGAGPRTRSRQPLQVPRRVFGVEEGVVDLLPEDLPARAVLRLAGDATVVRVLRCQFHRAGPLLYLCLLHAGGEGGDLRCVDEKRPQTQVPLPHLTLTGLPATAARASGLVTVLSASGVVTLRWEVSGPSGGRLTLRRPDGSGSVLPANLDGCIITCPLPLPSRGSMVV